MAITPFIPPSSISSLPPPIWSGVDGLPVFPYLPGQMPTVNKSPLWSTAIARATSGRERRTALWPAALWLFEVQYEVIRHRPTLDELATMWEFFNVAQGQYAPWLFVDPTDVIAPTSALQDPATGAPLTDPGTGNVLTDPGSIYSLGTIFGHGDGVTTVFPLYRQINSYLEPVQGAYQAYVLDNNSPAGSYTIANGIVTFSVAPANGHTLRWFGYYYFLCRFLQDDCTFQQIVSQLWSGQSLKFTTIRA